mgnify:CR=1 FL=1
MSKSIQESWLINSNYLKQGISLIPVRDKNDGRFLAKTPCFQWTKYQSEVISEAELFKQMEKYTAVLADRVNAIEGDISKVGAMDYTFRDCFKSMTHRLTEIENELLRGEESNVI